MRLFWLSVFTLIAGSVLVSLSVWQLRRLELKERLIAEIEVRAHATPQPLPAAEEWPKFRPEECRHVAARGKFEHDKEALVFRAGREPGYHVLTPLRLNSGGYVFVNRGFVPVERKEQTSRLAGQIPEETTITGLILGAEARNFFTPDDNPAAGLYYTSAPNVIAKQLGLAPTAPFIMDADASPLPGGWPKGETTVLALPNNHLSYALTWFSLALVLFGAFALFAWQNW